MGALSRDPKRTLFHPIPTDHLGLKNVSSDLEDSNGQGTKLSPTCQGEAQRAGTIQQLLISVDIRCNRKHRELEWDHPWLKKELTASSGCHWLSRQRALSSSSAAALTCVLFEPLLRCWEFLPTTHSGADAPQHGKYKLSHKERPADTRETKKAQQENWLCFSAKKSEGKRREKKIDRKSLFSFFFFKMCTVIENTENQSNFEHKTKGVRE